MTKIHGDPFHHVDYNAMVEGINQNGVLSGLTVSQHAAGADMSVDVAAGSALIDEEKYIETSVTNLVIDASESGKHRKDTIIYDTATSAPAVIKGTSIVITAAAVPPSVTADDILLAVVYIGDSVTSITDSDIYDGRIFITAIKDNWTATTNPTVNDDADAGYSIGSRWVNTSTNAWYVCTNTTVGAAVWTTNSVAPSGLIAMWHGLLTDIPAGWVLCDGTNGTPDLRDKFVRGASDGDDPGTTGGEDTHTLTIDEMPAHTHTCGVPVGNYTGVSDQYTAAGNGTTGSTGGGAAHNNIPAYYAIAFIMKT